VSISETRAGQSPALPQRAAALRPLLERHRRAGDQQRRLREETIEALTEAGLFRAFVPRRFGGLESDLRTIAEATVEVAKGDASAGWVVMILESADFLAGLYPEAAQEELYGAGPDTRICASITPNSTGRRVDGGWLLNSEWAPASGCLHSQWALLGFHFGDADDGAGLAVVPIEDLRIEDTWFTLGMRATGSHLLIGEDVFVPDHRVIPFSRVAVGHRIHERPRRYRTAPMSTMATYLLAPLCGIASAALEFAVEQADKRGVTFTRYERQSESTAFQMTIAEATTKLDVARLIAANSADILERHAAASTFPEQVERARIRTHIAHAVQQCREVVDSLVSAHGTRAMSDSNPLNDFLRDVHAASRHGIVNAMNNYELFGQVLLGVEPKITEFF
jgi:3-hydroxy-9,10-secoandrosta-1,3,5(10)-triene-9,17-dione monooxygenase